MIGMPTSIISSGVRNRGGGGVRGSNLPPLSIRDAVKTYLFSNDTPFVRPFFELAKISNVSSVPPNFLI